MDFLSAAFNELEDAAGTVPTLSAHPLPSLSSSSLTRTEPSSSSSSSTVAITAASNYPTVHRSGNTVRLPLINDIVNNLVPVLGPGVGCIVSTLTPPEVHMNNDNACGYVPSSSSSSTSTVSSGSSSSLSSSLSSAYGTVSTANSTAPTAVRINVPNVRSSIHGTNSTVASLLPSTTAIDFRTGIGSFMKCDDRNFLDAVLLLPLRSVMTTMVLRILVAQGYGSERLLSPDASSSSSSSSSHQRLEEPFLGTPYYHALPSVPRANFGQFFGKDYASNTTTATSSATSTGEDGGVRTVNTAQSRPPGSSAASSALSSTAPWPRNWVEYHATFATLLLEEGRSMVVQNALTIARTRLRKMNVPTVLSSVTIHEDEGPRSNLASSSFSSSNHNDYFITDVQLQAVNVVRTPSEGAQAIGARSFVLSFSSVPKSDRTSAVSAHSSASHRSGPIPQRTPQSSASHNGPSLSQMLQVRDFVLIRPNDETLESCLSASLAPSSSAISSSVSSFAAERTVLPCFLAIVHGRGVNENNDSMIDDSGNRNNASTCNVRIVVPGNTNFPFHTGRSWKLVKLGNLSTLLLQYNSLLTLPYTPFAGAMLIPSALKPTPLMNDILQEMRNDTLLDTLPPCPPSIPTALYRSLCRRYDPSQLRVILTSACGGAYIAPLMYIGSDGSFHPRHFSAHQFSASRTTAEITTVIGPPGTGKTRTVLGIISAFRASLQFPSSSTSSSFSVQGIVAAREINFTAKDTTNSSSSSGTLKNTADEDASLPILPSLSSTVPPLPSFGTKLSSKHAEPSSGARKPDPPKTLSGSADGEEDEDEFIDDEDPLYKPYLTGKSTNPGVINLADDDDSDGYHDYISISDDDDDSANGSDNASDKVANDGEDDEDSHPMKELDYLLEDDNSDEDENDSIFITGSSNSAIEHQQQKRLEKEAKLLRAKRTVPSSVSPKGNKVPRLGIDGRTNQPSISTSLVPHGRLVPIAKGSVVSATTTASAVTNTARINQFTSLKPNPTVRTAMHPLRPSTATVTSVVHPAIKVRILICTPSNAACDEICARLLDLPELPNTNDASVSGTLSPVHSPSRTSSLTGASSSSASAGAYIERHPGGLLDSNGKPFIPTVVRAGVGGTASTRTEVASVSIERHVQRRMCTLLKRLPITSVGRGFDAQALAIRRNRLAVVKEELGTKLKELQKDIAQVESLVGSASTSSSKLASPLTTKSKTAELLQRVGNTGNANTDSTSPLSRKSPRKTSSHPSSTKIDSGMTSRLRHLKREEKDITDCVTALSLDVALLIDPRMADVLRLQAIREVLEGCDVLCTTLAGSGQLINMHIRTDAGYLACLYESLPGYGRVHTDSIAFAGPIAAALRFDAFIVDEAGQAIEAETLIPLRLAYCGYPGAASASRGALLNNLNNENTANGTNNIGLLASTLPLAFCRRLVLVGDPLQLPATVLSPAAASAGLPVSLFERLAGANIRPLLLRIQYRMHSMISAFASIYFYRGLVRNALTVGGMGNDEGTKGNNEAIGEPLPDKCLHSLLLIDVPYGQESTSVSSTAFAGDPSRGNDAEVAMVVAVIQHKLRLLNMVGNSTTVSTNGSRDESSLTIQTPTVPVPSKSTGQGPHRGIIGVITFYNEQRRRIKQALQNALGTLYPHLLSQIIVATVDSFQGQEMDHIILSCVRSRVTKNDSTVRQGNTTNTNGSSSIGFVADERRLNVAITRARHTLTIIGNAHHLSQHDTNWKAFIFHIRTYGIVYTATEHERGEGTKNTFCTHLRKLLTKK